MKKLIKLNRQSITGNFASKLKVLFLGLCYGIGISTPVLAEDIEIYVTSVALDSDIQPNIMFLLDTSNSMGVTVLEREDYDATINYRDAVAYPGTGACFDNSRVYRINGNDADAAAIAWCDTGTASGAILGSASISNFFCKHATMIKQNGNSAPTERASSTGIYTQKIARYNPNGNAASVRWVPLDLLGSNQVVECVKDGDNNGAKHGRVAGDARVFPDKRANLSGNNRWTDRSDRRFNWGNITKERTYTGNYLNYLLAAPDINTYRIQVIRDVMLKFIDDLEDVNLGFMPYTKELGNGSTGNRTRGAMVEVPIADIGAAGSAQRELIKNRIRAYATHHDASDAGFWNGHNNLVLGTPSARQYFEALRYFKGDAPEYGTTALAPSTAVTADCAILDGNGNSIGTLCVDGSATVTPSDVGPYDISASLNGANYKSPVENECQANYVVLLTDGQPYADSITEGQLKEMNPAITEEGLSCAVDPGCFNASCSNSCLSQFALAGALLDEKSDGDKMQPISTFTIAFRTNVGVLNESTAFSRQETGKGESFRANNADDLRSSLSTIVEAIDQSATFSSPAVSVNAFNRSVHLDDLFFTLFKPSEGPRWKGNFKRYKISVRKDGDGDPIYDNNGNKQPIIVDSVTPTPNEAISATTGFFSQQATSYWSTVQDGDKIVEGGTAGALLDSRKVYTYVGGYTTTGGVSEPSNSTIITPANKIDITNKTNITASLLGVSGSDVINDGTGTSVLKYDALINWAAGLDVFDNYGTYTAVAGYAGDSSVADARLSIGDPLHSQPAIVQYGGTVNNPDLVAYVATNDGYLHAIDIDSGEELWSFVPKELLSLLLVNFENIDGDAKSYGLDGNVEVLVDDQNGDGTINNSDSVRIYVTQRRGGSKLYALDVTDRTDPKLEWFIEGGVSGDAYEELGQTWSTVNVEQVKDAGSATGSKSVLIFGGGYDLSQDDDSTAGIQRNVDTVGRTIFIADALTGARLWSARADLALSDMEYSIPARVKPLDISGDGNVDRLYAVDMGGQMFRFDIDETAATFNPASITGGRIWELAEDGSAANARRFYYPPDVALIADRGKAAYLAIAISSGYRAHPNNKDIEDRIYLLKDRDVFTAPSPYVSRTEANLHNATQNLAALPRDPAPTSQQIQDSKDEIDDIEAMEGWYINLDDGTAPPANFVGEKGLAEPLIVEGTIILTTFVPASDVVTPGTCSPAAGSGKVFYLDIRDATAAYPSSVDARSDRHIDLKSAGIPSSPTVIITEENAPTACIGTECSSLGMQVGARRTFLYEVEN